MLNSLNCNSICDVKIEKFLGVTHINVYIKLIYIYRIDRESNDRCYERGRLMKYGLKNIYLVEYFPILETFQISSFF